jgi:hypothetical protein
VITDDPPGLIWLTQTLPSGQYGKARRRCRAALGRRLSSEQGYYQAVNKFLFPRLSVMIGFIGMFMGVFRGFVVWLRVRSG